jgi:hypothetical protein
MQYSRKKKKWCDFIPSNFHSNGFVYFSWNEISLRFCQCLCGRKINAFRRFVHSRERWRPIYLVKRVVKFSWTATLVQIGAYDVCSGVAGLHVVFCASPFDGCHYLTCSTEWSEKSTESRVECQPNLLKMGWKSSLAIHLGFWFYLVGGGAIYFYIEDPYYHLPAPPKRNVTQLFQMFWPTFTNICVWRICRCDDMAI